MKSKILLLPLPLGSTCAAAQTIIENPSLETRQKSAYIISKMELSPIETWPTIRTIFRPQWWTSIDSLTYIYAPENRKQLYPLRAEGRKFGERITAPASGIIRNDCVITYPPLPEGTAWIDWMEGDPKSETNICGILLVKPQEVKEQALLREIRGNWQQTDAGNGWNIGIHDSLVIMDNRFWKYELCRKQGKKLKLNLGNETDGQCQLEMTQEKDGNIRIGKNGERKKKYIRVGLSHRSYASVTTTSITPRTDFFRRNAAHIRGSPDGYNPQLGFTAVLIYTDSHITCESNLVLATIHPDGCFELGFIVNYPEARHLSLGNCWVGLYVKPGETLILYLSWEDLLNYNRQRRLKPMLIETQYIGISSTFNQELMPCEPLFPKNSSILLKVCDTLTPDEFKAQQKPMYDLWMYWPGSLEQSKTP